MNDFKFELGQTVTDKILGFTGIVMARSQYLTQCNTYGLTATKFKKDGTRPDWEWFDEPRLEAVEGVKILSLVEKKKTGGPMYKHEMAPGK